MATDRTLHACFCLNLYGQDITKTFARLIKTQTMYIFNKEDKSLDATRKLSQKNYRQTRRRKIKCTLSSQNLEEFKIMY